jgi:hypothetical protein
LGGALFFLGFPRLVGSFYFFGGFALAVKVELEQDTLLREDRTHGFGGLGAMLKPGEDALFVEDDLGGRGIGVGIAEFLYEAAIAW